MYFTPFSITLDGSKADVVHMVGNLIKITYGGKEYMLSIEISDGKSKWKDNGKPVSGVAKKLSIAIQDHLLKR